MSIRLIAPWCFIALLPAQSWVARGTPDLSRLHSGSASVVFDETTGRLLVVDSRRQSWTGIVGSQGIEWSPQVGSLRYLNPANVVLAFDPARRCAIAAAFSPSETLEWDGDGWVQVNYTVAPPSYLATDHTRGCLVGAFSSNSTSMATRERVGTQWVPRGGLLSGTQVSTLAFDPVRGQVLMHGLDTAGVRRTRTWDGTTWTIIASNSGPDTVGFAMATDRTRGRVVAHGGLRGTVAAAESWEWDGASWTLLSAGLPAAWGRALVELPGRGVLALGGVQVNAAGMAEGGDEGHLWDGVAWTSMRFATPSWRTKHALGCDVSRGETVLFGGRDAQGNRGDTMVWNGVGWARRAPATSPSARHGAVMAFDPVRGGLQLFGGTDGGTDHSDLWQWNGATWSPSPAAATPPARSDAAMAFDAGRSRLVLFGGTNLSGLWSNDTWEWDGSTWQQAMPALVPVALRQPRLAYDVLRGRAVLHGQNGNSMSLLAGTYEWDGTNYTDFGGSHFRVGSQLWWDDAAGAVRAYVPMLGTLTWSGTTWVNSPLSVVPYSQVAGPSLAIVTDPGRTAFAFDGMMTWRATPLQANATDLGTGCGAAGRTPLLATLATPILGTTTGVSVALPAVAGGAAVIGLGFATGNTSLGSDCTWHLQGSVASLLVFTNSQGLASVPLALPPAPALRGLSVYGQALVLDSQAPLGFGLSQAIALLLGD